MTAFEQKLMDFPLSLKAIADDGCFVGYASVFDEVDNQQDVILRGAFARTVKGRGASKIKLLWQHDTKEPIGVFNVIKEDSFGLYVEGRLLLDLQRGREAYSLLKTGAVEGLSIGFAVKKASLDHETGNRIISDLELYEISLVTFPANSKAKISRVKSAEPPSAMLLELSDAIDRAIAAAYSRD